MVTLLGGHKEHNGYTKAAKFTSTDSGL
jgi:hypothetical protein